MLIVTLTLEEMLWMLMIYNILQICSGINMFFKEYQQTIIEN